MNLPSIFSNITAVKGIIYLYQFSVVEHMNLLQTSLGMKDL